MIAASRHRAVEKVEVIELGGAVDSLQLRPEQERFQPALEARWQPYLDGKVAMSAAMRELIALMPGTAPP